MSYIGVLIFMLMLVYYCIEKCISSKCVYRIAYYLYVDAGVLLYRERCISLKCIQDCLCWCISLKCGIRALLLVFCYIIMGRIGKHRGLCFNNKS